MAGVVTVKITGMTELQQQLSELRDVARVNAIAKGIREAAQPIIDQARRNAPSAEIAQGVRIVNVIRKREGEVIAEVGLPGGRKPWFHGLFHELGTGPRIQKSTGRFTGSMPARPWLRPAFDSAKGAALAAFGKAITTRIANLKRRGRA